MKFKRINHVPQKNPTRSIIYAFAIEKCYHNGILMEASAADNIIAPCAEAINLHAPIKTCADLSIQMCPVARTNLVGAELSEEAGRLNG